MNVQGGERWTIDADNQQHRSFGLPAFFAAASMVREGTVPPHLRVQVNLILFRFFCLNNV